jgi:perosamine synthetase
LSGVPCIRLQHEPIGCLSNFQSYVILLESKRVRDMMMEYLFARGVQTTIGTYSCHKQPVFKSNIVCKSSWDISTRSLSIPLYNGLKREEVGYICDALKKGLKHDKK